MLKEHQMEFIDYNIAVSDFDALSRDVYTADQAHIVAGCNEIHPSKSTDDGFLLVGKKDLVDYKKGKSTLGSDRFKHQLSPANNVSSFALEYARRRVELQNCVKLVKAAAVRSVECHDQHFDCFGVFDGLEDSREGGLVWVFMPYSSSVYNRIANLTFSPTLSLTDVELLYIEHLMLVANSQMALVTCSDGTYSNTVSGRYKSSAMLRDFLLGRYADFERTLQG